METGKAKPLYYKRVIWLKDSQQPKETTDIVLNILKDNIYIFKKFDIVLDVNEIVDFRHARTVYSYFEQLRSSDNDKKTLCVINHESITMIPRDILLSRVTKMWTSFSTAYINYNIKDNIRCNRSFNYIVPSDKIINRLSEIIQTGK